MRKIDEFDEYLIRGPILKTKYDELLDHIPVYRIYPYVFPKKFYDIELLC